MRSNFRVFRSTSIPHLNLVHLTSERLWCALLLASFRLATPSALIPQFFVLRKDILRILTAYLHRINMCRISSRDLKCSASVSVPIFESSKMIICGSFSLRLLSITSTIFLYVPRELFIPFSSRGYCKNPINFLTTIKNLDSFFQLQLIVAILEGKRTEYFLFRELINCFPTTSHTVIIRKYKVIKFSEVLCYHYYRLFFRNKGISLLPTGKWTAPALLILTAVSCVPFRSVLPKASTFAMDCTLYFPLTSLYRLCRTPGLWKPFEYSLMLQQKLLRSLFHCWVFDNPNKYIACLKYSSTVQSAINFRISYQAAHNPYIAPPRKLGCRALEQKNIEGFGHLLK